MIISILATDSLSEVDDRLMDYLLLKSYNWDPRNLASKRPEPCHLTGEATLFGAVRSLLSDPDDALTLTLELVRETHTARLVDTSGQWAESEFRKSLDTIDPAIERIIRFDGLFNLAAELDVASNPNSVWGSNPPAN